MRLLAIALTALLIAIQWPLWFGKGGWLRAWDLDRQLMAQRGINGALNARNAELAAEVASLREGREAIEERARHELNMVRDGEVFFQIVVPKTEALRAQASHRNEPASATQRARVTWHTAARRTDRCRQVRIDVSVAGSSYAGHACNCDRRSGSNPCASVAAQGGLVR